MYKLSESSRLARIATWTSPWPPWSSTVSWRAPCLLVWRPWLLLALRDQVRIVGELPACTYGDLDFSFATLIIYNQSESTLLARMATSASPCPPWSTTNCRRAPGLHKWPPWLLLGLHDNLQLVGEHPACTYGDVVIWTLYSGNSHFFILVKWTLGVSHVLPSTLNINKIIWFLVSGTLWFKWKQDQLVLEMVIESQGTRFRILKKK